MPSFSLEVPTKLNDTKLYWILRKSRLSENSPMETNGMRPAQRSAEVRYDILS